MNLTALQAALYDDLRYTASPPAAIIARILRNINLVQRELLTLPGMERLRDDVIAVTALANTARSGLPPSVARIKAIVDRTNNHKLDQVPLTELRLNDPSGAFIGGFPLRYANTGFRNVQVQPSAATGLWAVSSSAADTTQTIRVQTLTTGGYQYTDSKALNGVTRVQIGAIATRTDHIEVTKCYLTAVAAGYVSLFTAAAAGTELIRLEPGQLYSRFLTVEWHPVQTADATLYADVELAIQDLVNGTDEPMLPQDFHDLITRGVRIKEYELTSDDRLPQTVVEQERRKNALRSWVLDDGDRIASLRPEPIRWSRLGAMFPSGT